MRSHGRIFRLQEHMQRLIDSAKIYRMPMAYTLEQLCSAVVDLVEANGVAPCYIRPIAFRGYGEIGVNPLRSPMEVYIANYPWGKYVPGNEGADVCISSWNRLAPNTMPSLAKAGANYMNSQLIRMEAEINGYSEGHCAGCERLSVGGVGREPVPGARRCVLYDSAGELGAERDYPRLGADDCAGAGYSGGGAGAAAGDAVHRGRGLLYRNGRGGDAPAFGGPDSWLATARWGR